MKRSWNVVRDNVAGAWPFRTSVIVQVYSGRVVLTTGMDFVLRQLENFRQITKMSIKNDLNPQLKQIVLIFKLEWLNPSGIGHDVVC